MSNLFDDENLSEEEKAKRGMAMLGLLNFMKASNDAKKQEADTQFYNMAVTEKQVYDAYIKAGFDAEQAFQLTRDKVKLIIERTW